MRGDPVAYIVGLMRENYEAVGFLPEPTIRARYVQREHYILQYDERGRVVGYLLHGPLIPGHVAVVTQHVIALDQRLHGYGAHAVQTLLARCRQVGVDTVRLHCAEDLPSCHFWQHQGFRIYRHLSGGTARQRSILALAYAFPLPLFAPFTERYDDVC